MNEYESKLKDVIKGRVVVYIDAANLERSVKDMFVRPDDVPDNLKNLPTDTLCWSVDYKKLNEFFRYLLDKGLKFKLITKPIKEYGDHTINAPHRKANFDVEIAVDSTFSMKDFDTLILFSGDCDFDYLIKFLRGNEKVVIGFSRSGHVAKELPPALSHYFDIANFRTNLLQVGVRKAKSPEPFGPGPRN